MKIHSAPLFSKGVLMMWGCANKDALAIRLPANRNV
jgi:hypothetical protein